MMRLADAQPEPFRTISATLGGTGIDISDVLRLKRKNIDFQKREIFAPGTKTYNRQRVVRVADWAWSYLEAHCANIFGAEDMLFPDITRWAAGTITEKLVRR